MREKINTDYRHDLQGLRAIAVLLVILNHAGFSFFSGGFIGVDVFFVLSGYLINGQLISEYRSTQRIQFLAFIARRLKRLLPCLALVISAVMLVSPLLVSSQELDQQFKSVFFAASWTSNLFFAFSKQDYFAELQSRDIFLHTWSLGVEEQFYLAWPLILVAFFTLFLNRIKLKTLALSCYCLLFIASFALSLYWSGNHPLWSFYLMPARIWQFALGAAIFVGLDMHNRSVIGNLAISNNQGLSLGLAGLLLILGSGIFMHSKMQYPGYWALLPSLGAGLTIAAGYFNNVYVTSRILAKPWFVWIGNRSYSWYLWHWPVMVFGFAWGAEKNISLLICLILLSLVFSMMSYRWVELPYWKGQLSQFLPSKIILTSVLAIFIVAIGSLKILNFSANTFGLKSAPFNQAKSDLPVIYYGFPGGCDSWFSDAKIQPCVIGNNNAKNTVVLIGDSMVAMWVSMLPEMFKSPEWRTVVLTKSACPMVDEDFYYERIKKTYTVCAEWRKAAIDYVKSIHPDLIFTGSSPTYPFNQDQWVQGSKRIISQLSTTTENLILIPGTPIMSFDGPNCLSRWNADGPGLLMKWLNTVGFHLKQHNYLCREKLDSTYLTDVIHYLDLAIQGIPNVHLLDLNDLVCPDGVCSAQDSSKVIVFRDGRHVTNTFVLSKVPIITERLRNLVLNDYIGN